MRLGLDPESREGYITCSLHLPSPWFSNLGVGLGSRVISTGGQLFGRFISRYFTYRTFNNCIAGVPEYKYFFGIPYTEE